MAKILSGKSSGGKHRREKGEARQPARPPDSNHGEPRGDQQQAGNKWWTLTAVSLGTFMLLLDITIVNVALPKIAADLHASFSDIQWVIDAYALTLASVLLTMGALADLFGRKLLFTIGLSLFVATSLLCAVSPSSLFLILARGGQGVGGA
ncbi:MAG: hypothetical protein QOI06_1439, partial [Nocardioidaceae bacterium]|nr:hypothetical protein [Nocardioidaceae bacterium]